MAIFKRSPWEHGSENPNRRTANRTFSHPGPPAQGHHAVVRLKCSDSPIRSEAMSICPMGATSTISGLYEVVLRRLSATFSSATQGQMARSPPLRILGNSNSQDPASIFGINIVFEKIQILAQHPRRKEGLCCADRADSLPATVDETRPRMTAA